MNGDMEELLFYAALEERGRNDRARLRPVLGQARSDGGRIERKPLRWPNVQGEYARGGCCQILHGWRLGIVYRLNLGPLRR